MKQEVMKEEVGRLQIAAEAWRPERVLEWAFDSFGDGVAISSAFGAEGMALIDIASGSATAFASSPWIQSSCFPRPTTSWIRWSKGTASRLNGYIR